MISLLRNFSTRSAKRVLFKPIRLSVKQRVPTSSRAPVTREAPKPGAKSGLLFTLEGRLVHGKETAFAIAGQDFVLDTNTWIFGEIAVGAEVLIHGAIRNGGEHYAKKIVVKGHN